MYIYIYTYKMYEIKGWRTEREIQISLSGKKKAFKSPFWDNWTNSEAHRSDSTQKAER